jgi:hypothetical protein
MSLLRPIHDLLTLLLQVERRFEPFFRPLANRLLRGPSAAAIQWLINIQRSDEGLAIAEERVEPDEERSLQRMIDEMRVHLDQDFHPGEMERAGNTKTHGLCKGLFIVHDGLPEKLRQGLFAAPAEYPAWVRFSGPGPHVGPDIHDVGFGSIGVKLMGVAGPKLMDDETSTQDFTAVCTPTFVTRNTRDNADLQYWSRRHLPIFYFLNFRRPHILDFLMQALWNETQLNPFGWTYYSCVPYLMGEGQAMQYAFFAKTKVPMDVPGAPFRIADNYLRDTMKRTFAGVDMVEFEMTVQLQTDPQRMPIENAGVLWPTRLSPRVPVATLRIPRQEFDTPARSALARAITINPWHTIAAHRPLGNQSRARKRMYYELARHRQKINGERHLEPTGEEP